METFSVIKPTAPQWHILGCKPVATYHTFCHCQIRERFAQIMPNVSSFQPPPSPTAHHTVTTTSATATTMDANNNNNNEETTHDTTTKLLMWHAYGLTECAMSTVTFRMMMTSLSMTPGPHDEGQGPPPLSSTNNNDCPPMTTDNCPAPQHGMQTTMTQSVLPGSGG